MEKREEIKREIRKQAEDGYKTTQEKICPEQNDILGVRVPVLRKYAKELAKKDWKSYLEEIDNEYMEEKMLYGFIIGYAEMDWQTRMKYFEEFVQRVDNWEICDCCVASFSFIKENREAFWQYIEKYAHTTNEYENRIALVCLLDHYIHPDYLNRVYDILEQIQSDKYYVSMAKAWLLAELWIREERKTERYLQNAHISEITYKRTIRKMLDSYRVTLQKKYELRTTNWKK